MPEGSWAWYHKTYRFPDRTEYWDGEHPAPNRARAAASIENIQQSHKFVSIIDMKQTKDDYQLKMFPTNTYYHFTTVELSTLEITSKPKSVIITTVKHTKYSTARRDQKTIEVTILYFLIKNAKLNMSLIGDLKLEAMEQDEEGPQILHKITQPTEWADLTFTVLIASKYNKEGSVNIALTDKIGNKPVSAGSVDIPWVHWPRFTWHFKKIVKEIDEEKTNTKRNPIQGRSRHRIHNQDGALINNNKAQSSHQDGFQTVVIRLYQ